MNRQVCKMQKNDSGLYDLLITEDGYTVADVRNITFQRAVVEIEDHMHTKGGEDRV